MKIMNLKKDSFDLYIDITRMVKNIVSKEIYLKNDIELKDVYTYLAFIFF